MQKPIKTMECGAFSTERVLSTAADIRALEIDRKKLLMSKMKCEQEVVDWAGELQDRVHQAKELLLQQAHKLHKEQMEALLAAERSLAAPPGEASHQARSLEQPVAELHFVRAPALAALASPGDLGLVTCLPLLPAQLELSLDGLPLHPGARVSCSVAAVEPGPLPASVLSGLSVTAVQGQAALQLDRRLAGDGRRLHITFTAGSAGRYAVEARLAGWHVQGSPLLLPVLPDPAPVLARLGLQVGRPPRQAAARRVAVLREPRGPGSQGGRGFIGGAELWPAGRECLARWAEDRVWYRARVEGRDGRTAYRVTFLDYGNSDTVARADLVAGVADIPGSEQEMVDVNVWEGVDTQAGRAGPEEELLAEEESEGEAVAEGAAVLEPGVRCFVLHEGSWHGGIVHSVLGPELVTVKNCTLQQYRGVAPEDVAARRADLPPGARLAASALEMEGAIAALEAVARMGKDGKQQAKMKSEAEENIQEAVPIDGILKILEKEDLEVKTGPYETLDKVVTIKDDVAWSEGMECLARWEDSIWYRAFIFDAAGKGVWKVLFVDYGNEDEVEEDKMVRTLNDIPVGDDIDEGVMASEQPAKSRESSAGRLALLPLCRGSPPVLVARARLVVPGLAGPMGLAREASGALLVACSVEGAVRRYARDGQPLGHLQAAFRQPSDVLVLQSGQVAVRDAQGIHLFSPAGLFLRRLGRQTDRCFGLAEDGEGRLLTINCNKGMETVHVTGPGNTDIFYINVAEDVVVKRIELDSVLTQEEKGETNCRFLSFHEDKLYVVDLGKHRVFVFYTDEDGEEAATYFGEHGAGPLQFKAPSGLAIGDQGACLVADARNRRLQLVSPDFLQATVVRVDRALARPTGLCLDRALAELWVSDHLNSAVVCFSLGEL